MTTLITPDQFKKICPNLNSKRIDVLVPLINKVCPEYGIDTADIFHEFFANLLEESGCFLRYEENLTYTTPERLMQVWPRRFKTRDSAIPFTNNPKALAMLVYGKRQELGNLSREDGWLFRGAGPIQITGRGNFTAFAAWMNQKYLLKKDPEKWAELLRTSDEYGLHSACWIFAIAFKLIDEAERDEMKTIVKRINGGLTNYPIREKYYELAKKYIV